MKQNIFMLLLKSIKKRRTSMRYCSLLICIMAICFLVTSACSDDSYLSENSDNQDIKETMQSDIFNISHSGVGSSSPIGTLRTTPVVISSSSNPSFVSNPIAQTAIAQVAGNWHLELRDSVPRSVNLSLSQSEDVVFGTGSMTSGNVIQEVAAFGSVAGSKLNLELLSMTDISLFKLALDLKTPSASGSYKAVSASNATWTGTATGSVAA
jgi:hypothetical protein